MVTLLKDVALDLQLGRFTWGTQAEAKGRTFETSKKWIRIGGCRTDAHQCAVGPALGSDGGEISCDIMHNRHWFPQVRFCMFLAWAEVEFFREHSYSPRCRAQVKWKQWQWRFLPFLRVAQVPKRRALMQICCHCSMVAWRSHSKVSCDPWMRGTLVRP